MAALAKDTKCPVLGTPGQVQPALLAFPMAAALICFAGGMVGIDPAGNARAAAADPTLKIAPGVATKRADNSLGAAAAMNVEVECGAFYLQQTGTTITKAHFGRNVFVVDDQTISLDDLGGQRPLAGWVKAIGTAASGTANRIGVQLGEVSPFELDQTPIGGSDAFTARLVVTSIAAYTRALGVITANANGALANQDGIAPANGDVLLLPEGTAVAAADAGPWIVTDVGSGGTKFVLTRPEWWADAALYKLGAVIEVGPAGTLWKGSSWKTFATAVQVIGTDAPLLWPRHIYRKVTLVAGTVNVSAPLRSVTESTVHMARRTANTTASTVGYGAPEASRTAGAVGTGVVAVEAEVAAGTINVADISTMDVLITNW
jgi:hypothetical protein